MNRQLLTISRDQLSYDSLEAMKAINKIRNISKSPGTCRSSQGSLHSLLCEFWPHPGYSAKIQKTRAYALKHFEFFNAEYPEYVFPKIHNVVHKGSPVSYGIGLFPHVIEKLQKYCIKQSKGV